MSYGTRKAIAGTMAGSRFAAEGATLFIAKMNAAATAADIENALKWAKERGGWFLRTSADDDAMRSAHAAARLRVPAAASVEALAGKVEKK